MKNDLTIAKIKHTDFAELYDKFIIGKKLNQKQYETLLAIAICFTNADDINVQQWGYRIVVEYCNQTQDYMGKIKLTNAELIKALLLKKDNYKGESEKEITASQIKISTAYQIRLAKPALLILHPTNRMSFRLL